MGGDATFSGTSYQAKLIALVYVHVLTQSRLGWLDPIDDTPVGVSGESGGPGDDIRIELSRHPAFEVQAKHGLNAGASLIEFFSKVQQRTGSSGEERVVLEIGYGHLRHNGTETLDHRFQQVVGQGALEGLPFDL